MRKTALFALLLALLTGCASTATIARTDGGNAQWRGFEAIQAPSAHHEASISVRVIVTDNVGYPGAAATYSHPQGIIKIRGKVVNGKIVLCETVLGHEVLHALQFQAGGFMDPDKLTENGL